MNKLNVATLIEAQNIKKDLVLINSTVERKDLEKESLPSLFYTWTLNHIESWLVMPGW